MEEYFITQIDINKVRHLENISIKLSDTERKHLILTGKNGSGKTSVLIGLARLLYSIRNNRFNITENKSALTVKMSVAEYEDYFSMMQNTDDIMAYFQATKNRILKPQVPNGVNKLDLSIINQKKELRISTDISIIQYLVNLHFKKLNASNENDQETLQKIDNWFEKFTNILKEIFQDDTLKLKFDIDEMNFNIITKGREPFDFTTLSDGYAAFLNIVTELILRMESKAPAVYDVQGIVLIDEIETHLHIDLQKKIMPMLTTFFPKIQFIVTTHSPFVLSSISDAVIYDLESHSYLEDASDLSYSAIVKYHFQVSDEYSNIIKNKVSEYQSLIRKKERTTEENRHLYELDVELNELSPILSPELYLQFKNIQQELA